MSSVFVATRSLNACDVLVPPIDETIGSSEKGNGAAGDVRFEVSRRGATRQAHILNAVRRVILEEGPRAIKDLAAAERLLLPFYVRDYCVCILCPCPGGCTPFSRFSSTMPPPSVPSASALH